jgi:hypothetical protein
VGLSGGRLGRGVELVKLSFEFVLRSQLRRCASQFELLLGVFAGLSPLLLLFQLFTEILGGCVSDIRPLLQDSLDELLLCSGALGLRLHHFIQDTGQTPFAAPEHR